MTRVLVLSWEYPPIVEGGLARHVAGLAEQLGARGIEVHVLTRGGSGDAAAGQRAGVHVHRVEEPRKPRDLDAFLVWVDRMNADMVRAGEALQARYSFDVVHGHDWLVAMAADRLARDADCPLVMTVHATEHGRHQGWVDKHPQSYIHAAERWITRRADRVITCSHYMRGHVADVFGLREEAVAVIPNGIDADDLVPVADLTTLRARFAAPDEQLVLLTGRLVYEKGFQHALDALAGPEGAIAAVENKVCFLVAGSGPYEAELKQQAVRLGLTRHGMFLGWIGDDALHSLYRICDLCVIPSLYEPFSLVALEAMASGCPCIVADTGGLREVVPHDVGLRFKGGDAKHLGVMIERMLTDAPLRDRLVAEASEHVLRFDWAEIARETGTLYDTLVAAAPRTAA
jgi:glycogen(starch) synthase